MPSLMTCGHTSNATFEGKPICVICNCKDLSDGVANLDGRTSRCSECKKETRSSFTLAFFKHTPEKKYDQHFCGCSGWS